MKYADLVEVYEKLDSTTKRLEKTHYISEFLKKVPTEDLPHITLLLQGRIFPASDERKIGVASKIVIKAINVATGLNANKIETEWKKTGDLGEVAENLTKGKSQRTLASKELTVKKVFDNIRKLAELEGAGSVDAKIKLIAELLGSAAAKEAKYIVRTILEDLRIGVADGTLRDAIVWAFFEKEVNLNYDKEKKSINPDREKYNEYSELVQKAFNVSNDFGEIVIKAKEGAKALGKIEMKIGRPIKVMLYQKANDIKDAFEKVGKPAALEFKYDGFRIQIHKTDSKIKLFTRRFEDVTTQFPDVVESAKKYIEGKEFILDSEAVGFNPKTKKYLPFQSISQRIKRKYDIEKMAEKFPVEVNVFDVIAFNGESYVNKPFKERRKLIEKIITNKDKKLRYAKQLVTDDAKKAEKFYKESLAEGEEGIMVKNLEGIYKPGSRVGFGVKVKPVMETLDLVIISADWGEGKRKGWLSSYTVACFDQDNGELVEVGKVSTGLKELEEYGVSFQEMTEVLKPLIVKEKGKHVDVKPKIVIEVNYEEIQKSPTYTSGFALRFPRVKNLRLDKPVKEIATLAEVEELYYSQKKK